MTARTTEEGQSQPLDVSAAPARPDFATPTPLAETATIVASSTLAVSVARAPEPAPVPAPLTEPPMRQPAVVTAPPSEGAAPVVATLRELDLPPVSLTLPPGSGLELVETRHVQPVVAEPEEGASRPRRVRPQRVQMTEEPLQMVETRPGPQEGPPHA
jgi:hypothetical protein